ncbi:hypothetical protein SUGI_1025720 [Cryptomeria japonica]|uniref:uncharacterized protein LOC131858920 n=1 Tax=Cryptomeria japonica TaxID=3369 RepID=UPI002414B02D|nr:uncharacterized protein LOC131858920 [Cryptomeria japonica]XP_059069563.1 uncharacterized protein LOC131859619 [Cryptomeria japonica]XP_059069564.1 uncharacterized protein LOC131029338 [Cryptomeria japonica]GLJ48614.1 hypothetical protein SUGI_1025680 [Cryptomeria japonica]GLJ48618.1 hypothetical protein SUGI_1025720 [Cryptomeria japonica]
MDSMEAKSDGQLEETDPVMAGICISWTAFCVCLGFRSIITTIKANGLFFNLFVVGAIVASFIVALVLVITRTRGADRTFFRFFFNSAIFCLSALLAVFYTVQPSSYIISLKYGLADLEACRVLRICQDSMKTAFSVNRMKNILTHSVLQ